MGKPTKTDSAGVQRDEKGRIVPGSGAINGGGLTKEQRAARDTLNRWLCEEPQVEKGKQAYMRLLEADNPVIVKDFMDRVAGKAKEHIEHSGEVGGGGWPLTREETLAIAKKGKL